MSDTNTEEVFSRSRYISDQNIDTALTYIHENIDSVKTRLKSDLRNKEGSSFGFPPVNNKDEPQHWWPEHWHWFIKKFNQTLFNECLAEVNAEKPAYLQRRVR